MVLLDKTLIVLSKDAKFLKNISIEELLLGQDIKIKSLMFDQESEYKIKITKEDDTEYLMKLNLSNLKKVKISYIVPKNKVEVANDKFFIKIR